MTKAERKKELQKLKDQHYWNVYVPKVLRDLQAKIESDKRKERAEKFHQVVDSKRVTK